MPPELRRIWFIWISWISWVCMQLSSLSHLVTESERLLIQTLTQNVITHHEEKKWYWISVIFLIVPTAFFVFFGSAQWYDFTAHCQKEKKTRLTCVTFGILCFNGFALCPVFLRDNTTVSHVCATDLKISQLWVLLALRFIILGHAVCDSYSCIGSLLKQGPPFPSPTLYIFADGREGQENCGSWSVSLSLISQCDNPRIL